MQNLSIGSARRLIRKATTVAILLAAFSLTGQAFAASECKGLDNKACGAKTSCSWVNGYERKDGKTVKSFCRAKAKPKASNKNE